MYLTSLTEGHNVLMRKFEHHFTDVQIICIYIMHINYKFSDVELMCQRKYALLIDPVRLPFTRGTINLQPHYQRIREPVPPHSR